MTFDGDVKKLIRFLNKYGGYSQEQIPDEYLDKKCDVIGLRVATMDGEDFDLDLRIGDKVKFNEKTKKLGVEIKKESEEAPKDKSDNPIDKILSDIAESSGHYENLIMKVDEKTGILILSFLVSLLSIEARLKKYKSDESV